MLALAEETVGDYAGFRISCRQMTQDDMVM